MKNINAKRDYFLTFPLFPTPLKAMDLERLLNRRPPRKRPATSQMVILDSEPEDDEVKICLSGPWVRRGWMVPLSRTFHF